MRRKEVLELLEGKVGGSSRGAGKTKGAISFVDRVAEPTFPYRASVAPTKLQPAAVPIDPFKMSAVEVLASHLGVHPDFLMEIIGISGRTAQRRWHEGELTLEESDRLYRVARIVQRAIEVLGAEAGARLWLRRPQAIFSGSAPLALLGSDAGVKAVEDQLGRIDYGIVS